MVSVHNEEANIELKLENIKGVSYPMEKMEVIVVDDVSDDGTVEKVERFMQKNPEISVRSDRIQELENPWL